MQFYKKEIALFSTGIAASLIAYFFIMEALGLIHNFNLRLFNLVIIATGIYLCIRHLKKYSPSFNYIRGLGAGVMTSLFNALLFSIFICIYLFSNPDFMAEVKAVEPQGMYLNEFSVAFLLFIELTAAGALVAFVSMQWLKKDISKELTS